MRKLFTSVALAALLLFSSVAGAVDRNLSWQDNSTNESGFQIQSCPGTCTNSSTWTTIGSTGQSVNTFKVIGAAPGVTTSYRVLAFNISGVSLPSNIVVDAVPSIPSGPTTVSVQPCSSITATADATGSIWTIACIP